MIVIVIKILIIISVTSIFAFCIHKEMLADKQREILIKSQINKIINDNIPKFSVSAYLQRIQDLSDKLQHEKDQSDKHGLVLWWGIDGLRLNDDGSCEWIKKEPKRYISIPALYPPAIGGRYESMVHQTCCTSQYQRLDSMLQCQQSRIDELQMQNTMLQLQCAQQQQMQNMIDTIRPQMVNTPNFLLGGYYGKCC